MQPTTTASASTLGASSSPAPTQSAGPAQGGFVAVRGAPADGTSAELMLVLAYILMWTLLLGFVYFGFRRQHRLAKRIEHLEQALDGAEEDVHKE